MAHLKFVWVLKLPLLLRISLFVNANTPWKSFYLVPLFLKFEWSNLWNSAKPQGDLLDDSTTYGRLLGWLLYLTHTRPDINYAVHTLSQLLDQPCKPHLDAAMRVLRYKGSPGQCFFFPSSSEMHTNAFFFYADWTACLYTHRSSLPTEIYWSDSSLLAFKETTKSFSILNWRWISNNGFYLFWNHLDMTYSSGLQCFYT